MSLLSGAETGDFGAAAAAMFEDVNRATALFARDQQQIPDEVKLLVKDFAHRLDLGRANKYMASVDPTLRTALVATAWLCEEALDSRAELRIRLEQFRQLLRDVVDERPVHPDRDPQELAQWLLTTVGLPRKELAEVMGVSPRTLQGWAAGTAAPIEAHRQRLQTVAAMVAHLRHSYTGPGVVAWMTWPHPLLGNRAPAELLDEPEGYKRLTALASAARSQTAT